MSVGAHVYVCACMQCIHLYDVLESMCTHMYRHTFVCTCLRVCLCVRTCVRMYACVTTRPLAELPSFFLLLLSQDDIDNYKLKLTLKSLILKLIFLEK